MSAWPTLLRSKPTVHCTVVCDTARGASLEGCSCGTSNKVWCTAGQTCNPTGGPSSNGECSDGNTKELTNPF